MKAAPPLDREPNCRPAMGRDMDIFGWTKGQQRQKQAPALPERCTTRAKPHFRSFNLKVGSLEHQGAQVRSRAPPLRPLVLQAQGRFSRHHPRALVSGARGLQPGVTARSSSARVGVGKRAPGARGLQTGVSARCSSARVGVVKRGARAWKSFLRCESACARARSAVRSVTRRRAEFSLTRAGGRGRAPVGEGAEAHDLQPGEVHGVSAWAKARRPAGPQPGVVAM